MRLSAHLKAQGADVHFRRAESLASAQDSLFATWDAVYASAIFERTKPVVEALRKTYPDAVIGGTGSGSWQTLEDIGVASLEQDYSIYPTYKHSVGFSQRGCRLKCTFCVVPRKEGAVRSEQNIGEIWRGEPYPRNILLLDNDFFGQADWRSKIAEIQDGNFKVSFNQGINARMLNDESAAAIGSVKYYDDDFERRCIYTAWDNRRDEKRLMAGLEALARHGVKPDHIMVYVLVGYWPGETLADAEYRRARLREFGARPYPMPFVRTKEAVGFQRWVIGAYDKRIAWADWVEANYEPRQLGKTSPLFDPESGQ